MMKSGEIVSKGLTRDVITERMVRDVFHMNSRVEYDEDLEGLAVTLISRYEC